MSGGVETGPYNKVKVLHNPGLAMFVALLDRFNKAALIFSMVALGVTSVILSYSVVARYFLHIPTDWQDEASIFMLVGVIFLTAAYVQSHRGHIGIEALASMLPARINKLRMLIVDLTSLIFCSFFSWKSWTLCHEAWVEGQTTSSNFAPPLWIPYSVMAIGMSVLSFQILAQVLTNLNDARSQTWTHSS
jgi:TRAP-type C4-dicarboxylate transport system permease small subunit